MARKPKPLPSFCTPVDVVVNVVRPPMNTPVINTRTDQSIIVTGPERIRDSIQTARPSIIKPKAFFTATIQAPALGSTFPCAAPTSNNGAPMPRLIANNALPPRNVSPVCAMTVNAAIRAGATQAVTINDDKAPMMNAPIMVPLFCLPLIPDSRL